MPLQSRLDKVYAHLLLHHPYGWALYKKITTANLQPGYCGYFDADGDWRTLVDLKSSPEVLASHGWTVPEPRIMPDENPESVIWGPKQSTSTASHSVKATVGASAAVAPIEASVRVSYNNETDSGAVLLTENPVWRHCINSDTSALQWMSDNTPQMFHRYKDIIKKHGIWIVTKTYSTHRCAIAVMTSRASAVEIRLRVNLQGVLELTPESEWKNASGSLSTELHEDERDVVVFISGMYFTQRLLRTKLKHEQDQAKQKIFRQGDDGTGGASGVEGNNEVMELVAHYFPGHDDDESDEA